jgi:hypothetical protein
MIFLDLIFDVFLLFALWTWAPSDIPANYSGEVNEHTIHGHLPGPSDHSGNSHQHHGQHGHIVSNPGGHEIFH